MRTRPTSRRSLASFLALFAIRPLPPLGAVSPARARRDPGRPALRPRATGDPGLVRDRPQRDDLRDADIALSGPRARRLRHRAGRARAHGCRSCRRGVPRRLVLGLGLGSRADRSGHPARRRRLGAGDHRVRAGHCVVPAGPSVPRVRGRRGRLLGGLPLHARPVRDARRAPRPGHVDPHASSSRVARASGISRPRPWQR